MRVLVFGSLNIDYVYRLPHLVRPGETVSSRSYTRTAGGKGFNQAVALARAGQSVRFAGAIGQDGLFLRDYLQALQVDTEDLRVLPTPSGHALIQVDDAGQNSIILFGGANEENTPQSIQAALQHMQAGEYVLLQNEISAGAELLHAAHARGLRVILNPSPVSAALKQWPLHLVDMFVLNEVEGQDLTGESAPLAMLHALTARFAHSRIVLTLGSEGAWYADATTQLHQCVYPTAVVDTTAAGDTFTGYFIHTFLHTHCPKQALQTAACAAALSVSRMGAAQSIPTQEEVRMALRAL